MRKVLVAAVAVALLAPASAMAFPHGPHWGGPGFHHGWGWGGVGLGLGFGLGAVVLGDAACVRERPIYNAYGEYVGSRRVNVCY